MRLTEAGAPVPAGGGGRGGGEGGGALTVQGLPLIKPPYGRITALDMNKGTLVWQIAHGETPDNIRNHPALKGVTIPRTGRQGRIGVLVTKTLVIAGEGGFCDDAERPRRDAAGVRQGDGPGTWRGVHAGAANRVADDLPAQWQAAPRPGDQRPGIQWRVESRFVCRLKHLEIADCRLLIAELSNQQSNQSQQSRISNHNLCLQEFQILFGDQIAIQDVIGSPFQVHRLTGEHLAFRCDPCEADFENLSNRARQRRRQRGVCGREESRAAGIGPDRQER